MIHFFIFFQALQHIKKSHSKIFYAGIPLREYDRIFRNLSFGISFNILHISSKLKKLDNLYLVFYLNIVNNQLCIPNAKKKRIMFQAALSPCLFSLRFISIFFQISFYVHQNKESELQF